MSYNKINIMMLSQKFRDYCIGFFAIPTPHDRMNLYLRIYTIHHALMPERSGS